MYDDQTKLAAIQQMDRTGVGNTRTQRPMERIGDAADRVESLITGIMLICDRFTGPSSEANGQRSDPIAVSYLSNIDRLHARLDVVDQMIAHLSELA